jgi:hypothetical protein
VTDIPADAPRSEDGQWWWDGTVWQPVDQPADDAGAAGLQPGQGSEAWAPAAAFGQVSEDGQWWWDGTAWQPAGPAAGSSATTSAQTDQESAAPATTSDQPLGFAHVAVGLDPQMVAAAKKELELESDMEQIGAYAPDDYQKYQDERRILADFVDSAESSNPNMSVPAPDEWHKELQLIGEARLDLCNNARVALESGVKDAERHLESERQSLERVIVALEDFKEAQESAEAAEKLSSTLMQLNELVEVIHEPEKMYDVLKEKITGSPDDIIEAGIRDLGQYYEQVTLAGHGFSSFDDMANFAKASVKNVVTAGEALGDVVRPYEIAKKDYDIPVTH